MKRHPFIARYAIYLFAALALHAALLFSIRQQAQIAVASQPEETETVELDSSPEPTPPPIPQPTPQPTPEPTPEPTPVPTPTPTPEPSPEIPEPTPTPTPAATPKPTPQHVAPPKPIATPHRVGPKHHVEHPKPAQRNGSQQESHPRITGQASYLYNPEPDYPEESKTNHEQGVVMLLVHVGSQGRVESASVIRSSGFSRLDAAAKAAVLRWKFRPATSLGIPVACDVKVPVRFHLE